MSLTVALNSARLGLQQAEKQITVVSSNINNADQAGYTRKVLQSTYSTTGLTTVPIGGTSVAAVSDPLLIKQVNQQSTISSAQATLSSYLSSYVQSIGGISDSSTTLSSNMDTLTASLQVLEETPSDSSAKAKVITTAQTVASSLNDLSSNLQDARESADSQIGTTVTSINQSLASISDLNKQIAAAQASGSSTADLEDTRNQAVLSLSQNMGVQYFVNGNNQMLVYTSGGTSLVGGSSSTQLSYVGVGQMSSTTTYPSGGIPGIMMNGVDITNTINTGGTLGALVTLRDTTLPNEQAKLDSLATTLKQTVNGVLNQGTAYPPLNSVSGSVAVNASTPLSSTGTLRVAVTSQNGTVQTVADLDTSTYATVGDLVTALNAISGVSASVSSGKLVISATTSTNGISLNPENTNIGGIGMTQFFGFNDLFTNTPGTALNASTIQVNPQLLANTDALATGTLSTTAVVGDKGITQGDASTVTALVTAMSTAQSFSAAGNFASRSSTLSGYAAAIITDVSSQASAAKLNADTASATYSYLSDNLSNETGVNIDEETANLTVLQGNYEANAQLISTIKDLFQTLLTAVQ